MSNRTGLHYLTERLESQPEHRCRLPEDTFCLSACKTYSLPDSPPLSAIAYTQQMALVSAVRTTARSTLPHPTPYLHGAAHDGKTRSHRESRR